MNGKKIYMSFSLEQLQEIRDAVMTEMVNEFCVSGLVKDRDEKEVRKFATLSSIVAQASEEIEQAIAEEF